MRSHQSHGGQQQGQSGRRSSGSRASRNIDDHLGNSGRTRIVEEETIYYTGPARPNLSSSPQRPARNTQQVTQVHTFQLDGINASIPFMPVGPQPDNQEIIGSAGDSLSMSLDRIDRMMNAAMSASGSTAQFFNNHNILVNQPLAAQAQQQVRRQGNSGASPLRNKVVYELECCYCQTHICGRAMRAILLADTKVELYSTDVPPSRLRLLDDDRMTQGCNCRIRDTACATCGNVMGYHVSQPCEKCLEARNNGHFWMFYSDTVVPRERADPSGNGKPLYWGSINQASDLLDIGGISKNTKPYECFCR